jgi:hypothetical protein
VGVSSVADFYFDAQFIPSTELRLGYRIDVLVLYSDNFNPALFVVLLFLCGIYLSVGVVTDHFCANLRSGLLCLEIGDGATNNGVFMDIWLVCGFHL